MSLSLSVYSISLMDHVQTYGAEYEMLLSSRRVESTGKSDSDSITAGNVPLGSCFMQCKFCGILQASDFEAVTIRIICVFEFNMNVFTFSLCCDAGPWIS